MKENLEFLEWVIKNC